ncbi:MAG: Holliday junction resolvase [Nanoarchaeota archaeon]|nr:Holliday junction resolvase [Nanoarchaeota archaeon]
MADFLAIVLALVFLVGIIIAYWVGYKFGAFRKNRQWEFDLPSHRKDAIMKSRAVLTGHFSEQLAPFLPDFNYSPTECRFIGKPIDFIVFKGADGKDINEVVFVEVKSGKSKLSPQEKKLKDTIQNGRVRWEEYRVDDDVTGERKDKE